MIAVWQGSSLNLYRLNNPRVGINYLTEEPDFGFYKRVILQQPIIYRAAWSHDGRTLAYSDGRGLWLWDVFALQAGPRLFLPTPPSSTIPYARYWSPSGRYLALAEGADLRNYDTVLASRLPDGIVSTDDRILLAFHTDAAGISNFSVCRLAPEVPCHHYDYGINQTGPDPLWISPTQYLIPTRVNDEHVINWDSTYRGAFGTTVPGSAFDYEVVSNTLVTLDTENMLYIVGLGDYRWQQIDLSAEIDQEIIAVEWLPSPFLILYD